MSPDGFWGPQMAEVIAEIKARGMYRPAMSPVQFGVMLNKFCGVTANLAQSPEICATEWLAAMPPRDAA